MANLTIKSCDKPGDAYVIESGHDASVIGDEPVTYELRATPL